MLLLAALVLTQLPKDIWAGAKTLQKGELAKVSQAGGFVMQGEDTRRLLIVREDGTVIREDSRKKKTWKLKAQDIKAIKEEINLFDPIKFADEIDHRETKIAVADLPTTVIALRSGKAIKIWEPMKHSYVEDQPAITKRLQQMLFEGK